MQRHLATRSISSSKYKKEIADIMKANRRVQPSPTFSKSTVPKKPPTAKTSGAFNSLNLARKTEGSSPNMFHNRFRESDAFQSGVDTASDRNTRMHLSQRTNAIFNKDFPPDLRNKFISPNDNNIVSPMYDDSAASKE